MKVVFVSSDNYRGSGAFKSMVKLIELLKQKHNVQVKVILPYHGNGEELLRASSIDYVCVPSFDWITELKDYNSLKARLHWYSKRLKDRKSIKQIIEILQDFQPDVVHINTSWSYVGAVAAYKLEIPVVWHIREFLEEDQQRRYWDKKFAYSLLKKANCVVAISQAIFDKYKKIIGEGNLRLVYNGIDENEYYYKHDIFESGNHLITVGGLNLGKGHATIINALGILKKRGFTDFDYLIVGEGPEKENLTKLIDKNKLDKQVEFYGLSKNPAELYKKSDIYLMGSFAEAFGRVTVEAMMSGLLVIGRDSAGTSEILQKGKYGLLFNDELNLADKLEKVLKDKDKGKYKALALKGQEYAMQVYTASVNADNVYHVYQDTLSQS